MYLETTQRASTQTDQRKTLQTEGTWGKLGTRLKLQRAEHHSGIQNIKYPVLGSVLGVTSESQSNRGSGQPAEQPAEQNMLPQSSWGGVSPSLLPPGLVPALRFYQPAWGSPFHEGRRQTGCSVCCKDKLGELPGSLRTFHHLGNLGIPSRPRGKWALCRSTIHHCPA